MLVVRDVFTAKPGQASKLAALFKKAMGTMGDVRVMTDYIGDFNSVIMEWDVKDLAEYEEHMEQYRSGKILKELDAKTAEELKKYADLFQGGRREILEVVE
jgi:hypothetical protein